MGRNVTTILIDPNPLFRDGLTRILATGPYRVAAAVNSLAEVCQNATERKQTLIILGDDKCDGSAYSDIVTLRRRNSLARIVVLSRDGDVYEMCRGFEAGADGYLTKSISSQALLDALDLIMADVAVAPACALRMLREAQDVHMVEEALPPRLKPETPERSDEPALIEFQSNERGAISSDSGQCCNGATNAKQLSPQEFKVILYVAAGHPNKCIARELGIAEATVKVHVKAILRKLGLHNRTQAAIWAREHGLSIVRELSKPTVPNGNGEPVRIFQNETDIK